jgi:hypothetical protein
MIALGAVIGPGTFYATGYALRYSGPIGALIGHIIVGLDVFFLTQCLGKMATLFPSTGSFNEFTGRFIDPALSFVLGWSYWYIWVHKVLRLLSPFPPQSLNSFERFKFIYPSRNEDSKYAPVDLGREKQTNKSKQVTILANEYNAPLSSCDTNYRTPNLRLDPDLLASLYAFIFSWRSCLRRDGVLACVFQVHCGSRLVPCLHVSIILKLQFKS